MTQIEFAHRNSQIKKLALEKYTADQIAEKLNLSRDRVMNILRSYKIKAYRKPNKLKSSLALKVIAELKTGTKQIEIAKKCNVSRQYVNQIKKQLEKKENKNEV